MLSVNTNNHQQSGIPPFQGLRFGCTSIHRATPDVEIKHPFRAIPKTPEHPNPEGGLYPNTGSSPITSAPYTSPEGVHYPNTGCIPVQGCIPVEHDKNLNPSPERATYPKTSTPGIHTIESESPSPEWTSYVHTRYRSERSAAPYIRQCYTDTIVARPEFPSPEGVHYPNTGYSPVQGYSPVEHDQNLNPSPERAQYTTPWDNHS